MLDPDSPTSLAHDRTRRRWTIWPPLHETGSHNPVIRQTLIVQYWIVTDLCLVFPLRTWIDPWLVATLCVCGYILVSNSGQTRTSLISSSSHHISGTNVSGTGCSAAILGSVVISFPRHAGYSHKQQFYLSYTYPSWTWVPHWSTLSPGPPVNVEDLVAGPEITW